MHVCGAVLYQDQVANRVKQAVAELREGQLLSRRPFQVTWFASQVAICLGLWEYNRTLIRALELGKTFLVPLEALNALWPCPGGSGFRDLSFSPTTSELTRMPWHRAARSPGGIASQAPGGLRLRRPAAAAPGRNDNADFDPASWGVLRDLTAPRFPHSCSPPLFFVLRNLPMPFLSRPVYIPASTQTLLRFLFLACCAVEPSSVMRAIVPVAYFYYVAVSSFAPSPEVYPLFANCLSGLFGQHYSTLLHVEFSVICMHTPTPPDTCRRDRCSVRCTIPYPFNSIYFAPTRSKRTNP